MLLIRGALTIALAVLAADAYLRLAVERELLCDTWFTPGVHTPDARHGFVFTPNFRGHMRHADGVWNVPLALDELGLRSSPPASGDDQETVLLIGGASMTMCYGLPDDQTIAAQLRSSLGGSARVSAVAWPGFDLYRTWHLYRQTLADRPPPRAAVLCVYAVTPEYFAELPADFNQPPSAASNENLFRYSPGLVVPSSGPLSQWLGPAYYNSPVLNFAARKIDRRLVKLTDSDQTEPRTTPAEAMSKPLDLHGKGLARFRQFLEHVDAHFRSRGTRCAVAFMPQAEASVNLYDELSQSAKGVMPMIDLHRQLHEQAAPRDFIASGHYGPRLANDIADRLAPACLTQPAAGMATSAPRTTRR